MFFHLGFKGFLSLHTVLFWNFCVGRYHYPWRVLHAVETLGAQGTRWLNSSLPHTPSPSALRAHTAAHTGKQGGVSSFP